MPVTFLANNFFSKLSKFLNVGATACTSTHATGTTHASLGTKLEVTFHDNTIVKLMIMNLKLLSVSF